MTITTTSTLPSPIQQSFSYKLLAVPVPYMIHQIPSMHKKMPRNGGSVLRMRRYNPLPTATVPLGNGGITPAPVNLTAVDIDTRINFYGQYILLNDQVTLQNQDPVLNEGTQRLGVSLRQTEDELIRNMLASTAAFINCVNGANADLPTNLTRTDIDTVVKALRNNNAQSFVTGIGGEDKFATAPVRDAYFGLGSTELIGELDGVDGFINKWNYPNPNKTLESEWGSVGNVRYLLSSIGSLTANASALGANVFNIFHVAKESYCCVEQDGYSAAFLYRPPIYDSPLALNASIGWKMANAQVITNDAWVISLRCTLQ